MKKWSLNVNIQSGGNFYRQPTNKIPTQNVPGQQPLSIAFYPLCKSIFIFVKQAAGLSHCQKWEQKPKHLAHILGRRFKAICNQYESNEIMIRSSQPVF